MNIVEFALKFKDFATDMISRLGALSNSAINLVGHNGLLQQSYYEIAQAMAPSAAQGKYGKTQSDTGMFAGEHVAALVSQQREPVISNIFGKEAFANMQILMDLLSSAAVKNNNAELPSVRIIGINPSEQDNLDRSTKELLPGNIFNNPLGNMLEKLNAVGNNAIGENIESLPMHTAPQGIKISADVERFYRQVQKSNEETGHITSNFNVLKENAGNKVVQDAVSNAASGEIEQQAFFAGNTADRDRFATETGEIWGGGSNKAINITVPKLLDNIIINTASLSESAEDIESRFREMLGRVIAQGATQ